MSGSQSDARAAVVEARYQMLAARFGDRFDAAAEEKLRADLARLVEAAETLRAFPVANGDEPDFVFPPVRRDG
jgi:hypothetical protein